jgi:hypothetical protein
MTGTIALACAQRGGRSYLARIHYDGLWRVSRPQRDGDDVRVVAAHLGPGIIGGDRYASDVHVAAGARLMVTGQMATPVYARDGASSTDARWQVAPGASLAVRGEPLMLDAGARHDVRTTIEVAGDGCAIVADVVTVAPGALARLRTIARIDGQLVARDACDLRGSGGAIVTLIAVCAGAPARAAMAARLEPILAAAPGVRGGLGATAGSVILRATSDRVWAAQQLVAACVRACAGEA